MKRYCTMITGACGGLGRAFVKILAENKENLILVGTSQKKLDGLLADFSTQFSDIFVRTFVCDLSKKEDREKLAHDIKSEELIVDKLINNAGVIIEGDLLKFPDEEIAHAIEVNCVGTLDITKKLIEARDEQKKFEVLTVSSQSAFQPIPHMAVYSATKSFLLSMMAALSVELKEKNVVITTVCPSGIATTDAMKESIKSMGISGKLTTLPVEKIAKIALKSLKKRKTVVIPGKINKFVRFLTRFCSVKMLANSTGRLWKKSQAKRGI